MLGILKFSKGTVDWTHRGHDHENPYQLTWTQFVMIILAFYAIYGENNYHGDQRELLYAKN